MSKFIEVLADDGKDGNLMTFNYDEILLVIESDEGAATIVMKNRNEYKVLTFYNVIIRKLAKLAEIEKI